MPTMLRKQLAASVGALSAERLRLEDELLKMEKQMATPTDTDQMIRALKAEVDAGEQRLAEQRELLARAEAQRQVLARDRAAADAAARQAEHDAAVQALRAEVEAYLSDFAALCRNLNGVAHGIAALEARMREIAVWSQSLTGRVPMVCERQAHERRLSFLVGHHMRRVAGHRDRLGVLVWPAYSDAEHRPGDDPVEAERERLQRHILDPLATTEA